MSDLASRAGRPHVVVLTYHSIDDSESPVSVSAVEFRRQLASLAAGGWRSLTSEQFLHGIRSRSWPERSFLLTFDDGYVSLLEAGLEIASAHGFTGVVFVATQRVGGVMSGPGEPSWTPTDRLLDWNGLRQVAAAGWTIGSHAASHRRLTQLSAREVVDELDGSAEVIAAEIGRRPALLAYPYGASSAAVERLAGERYDAAFGTVLARVSRRSRPSSLERIDTYYLRGLSLEQLDGTAARLYLGLRRAARVVRARSL